VFILKIVKVACFVIVLQVFILKVLAGSEETARSGLPQRHGDTEGNDVEGFLGEKGMPIPVFSYEWRGKDLQEQECVRVANTGLRNRAFCERVHRSRRRARKSEENVLRGANSGPWRMLRRVSCELRKPLFTGYDTKN
jgi:hypothetical protein